MWKTRIDDDFTNMFPVLCNYIFHKPFINTEFIFSDVQQQLELLSGHFKKYFFRDTYENFDEILKPFVMISFSQTVLSSLWLRVEEEYPLLLQKATESLLSFANTYMCGRALSVVTYMKTKYRYRRTSEPARNSSEY